MAYKLGDVLASIRRRRRFDQKEVADYCDISVSYLSQIENNGKHPSHKVLKELSKMYNTPVSDILFEAIDDYRHYAEIKPLIDKMLSILLK